MRVYKWQQVVTYTVSMCEPGEIDEETGTAMATVEEVDESAKEWQQSAMPCEYYPEDFVVVHEGEVKFLGVHSTVPPQ